MLFVFSNFTCIHKTSQIYSYNSGSIAPHMTILSWETNKKDSVKKNAASNVECNHKLNKSVLQPANFGKCMNKTH